MSDYEVLPPSAERAREYETKNQDPDKVLLPDGSVVVGIMYPRPFVNVNLDVALSTRLKPTDTLTKVTTIDTITNPVTAIDSNQAVVVYIDGSVNYICKAVVGTAVATAAWQIKKIDATAGVVIKWCDGNANYDNVATSLAVVKALSYS
jgi:hypothetical protein